MKTLLFHGTSADNLPHILKHGLKADSEAKLWNCSEDAVYFWSVPAVMESENLETVEEALNMARQNAIGSGQIALSLAKDCRIIIICAEIEETELEEDQSCENMYGAVCVYRDVLPHEIKSIEISNDLSLLKGYFMAMVLNRDLTAIELSPLETKVAECFKNLEVYDELESLIEFEPVKIRGRKISKCA